MSSKLRREMMASVQKIDPYLTEEVAMPDRLRPWFLNAMLRAYTNRDALTCKEIHILRVGIIDTVCNKHFFKEAIPYIRRLRQIIVLDDAAKIEIAQDHDYDFGPFIHRDVELPDDIVVQTVLSELTFYRLNEMVIKLIKDVPKHHLWYQRIKYADALYERLTGVRPEGS